jgi:hypothetical protein
MAVTGCVNGNTGRKIEKNIIVDIVHPESFRLINNKRINPRVRGGDKGLVKLDQFFCLWAR